MDLANWQWCALYGIVMGLFIFLANLLIDDNEHRSQATGLAMVWPFTLALLSLAAAATLAIAPFFVIAWLANKGRVATALTAKDDR